MFKKKANPDDEVVVLSVEDCQICAGSVEAVIKMYEENGREGSGLKESEFSTYMDSLYLTRNKMVALAHILSQAIERAAEIQEKEEHAKD